MKGLGEHIPAEKRHFIHSLIIPLVFLLICWLVKAWEMVTTQSFVEFGINPRTLEGLPGIFFAPFIHGDLSHITTNSISFLILAVGLFYFYRTIALKTFIYIFFVSNILLWIGGRPSWHIGASGIIYGLGAFQIVSGIIRRNIGLVAISLTIIFAYGSMFWHIFPLQINDPISWEGHLMGTLTGVVLAVVYRNQGPQRQEWEWHEEIETDQELNDIYINNDEADVEPDRFS